MDGNKSWHMGFNHRRDQHVYLLRRLIRPDIVISHSCWNDAVHGMTTNNHALNQFGFIYNMYKLPKRLGFDVKEKKVFNAPKSVAKSYTQTAIFFKNICYSNHTKIFIKGIQPICFRLDKRSKTEIQSIKFYDKFYDDIFSQSDLNNAIMFSVK